MKTETSPVPMTGVTSSQVHSLGYDAANQRLHVYFPKLDKDKKVVGVASHYSYANFPPEKFEEMMAAESKGSFFIQKVKKMADVHPFTKHEPEKEEGDA